MNGLPDLVLANIVPGLKHMQIRVGLVDQEEHILEVFLCGG